MASKLTDQIVDKRLVERNIRKGLIDRKGVEKHIADTKDVAANAEAVPYYDPEVPEEEEGATAEAAAENTLPGSPAPVAVAPEAPAFSNGEA